MKASKDLALFHIHFYGVLRRARADKSTGVLTIGINHTNQDFKEFAEGTEWQNDTILQAWRYDMQWAESMANLWLNQDVEQNQFNAIVDLLLDDVFQLGYRPYTLLDMCKAHDDNACDQFLRWVIDKNNNTSLEHIRRAFARRSLYLNCDYKCFLKPQLMVNNLEALNLAIKPYGYRAIQDNKKGYILERFS